MPQGGCRLTINEGFELTIFFGSAYISFQRPFCFFLRASFQFGRFLMAFEPERKIAQHIHVVDKGFVRGVVRIKIFVNITVREKLRAHVIKVVARLQVLPIL
jgi:hypothetical protein